MKLVVEKHSPITWDGEKVNEFINRSLKAMKMGITSQPLKVLTRESVHAELLAVKNELFDVRTEMFAEANSSEILFSELNNNSIVCVEEFEKVKYIVTKVTDGIGTCYVFDDQVPIIKNLITFNQTIAKLLKCRDITLHAANSMKEAIDWLSD